MKNMKNKELLITPPEGYEIDKENSTFEKISFKPILGLPKTWEELKTVDGYFIGDYSDIQECTDMITNTDNKNIFPTKELAGAVLALAQLLQLRNRYNGDNKGFINGNNNYCLVIYENRITPQVYHAINTILAFRTKILRDTFYNNFKDLIEIAKPLL